MGQRSPPSMPLILPHKISYVTGPSKIGLNYTKYTCSYYGIYFLFCMCYPKSVSFIEFLMDFCIHDDILDTRQITNKKLLHFKLSKSDHILHVDKTGFLRPSHIYNKAENMATIQFDKRTKVDG